jgi:hypothetical protein
MIRSCRVRATRKEIAWKTRLRTAARTAVCLLTIGAFLALTLRPAWAACTKDSECKGDRICESGLCVSPPAPAVPPVGASPPSPSAPDAAPPPAAVAEPDGSSPPPQDAIPNPSSPAPKQPSELPNAPTETAPLPPPPPPLPAPTTAMAPATQPARETAALTVTSGTDDAYVVSFESHDRIRSESCTTPCTLSVAPGSGTLDVRGPRDYARDIVVSRAGTSVVLKTSCPECLIWGGISVAVGAGLGVLGYVALKDIPDCVPYSGNDLILCDKDETKFIVYGSLLTSASAAFGIVGLISLIKGAARGANRVEVQGQTAAFHGMRFTGGVMTPARGAGGVETLRFEF